MSGVRRFWEKLKPVLAVFVVAAVFMVLFSMDRALGGGYYGDARVKEVIRSVDGEVARPGKDDVNMLYGDLERADNCIASVVKEYCVEPIVCESGEMAGDIVAYYLRNGKSKFIVYASSEYAEIFSKQYGKEEVLIADVERAALSKYGRVNILFSGCNEAGESFVYKTVFVLPAGVVGV